MLSRLSRARGALSGVAALAALTGLAGCSSLQTSENFLGVVTPYRVEVVQGNVVTKEQVARVRPGMTRAQVRDVLGSPLLTDLFHANRWDYVFTIRRQGTEPQARHLVVRFEGDQMTTIEGGDGLPGEREFVASIDTFRSSRSAPTLALSEEQLKALPVPQKPAPDAPAEPIGATRSFPPLEGGSR